MPELPEVEVTRQAIAPVLTNKVIKKVTVRRTDLRWPVSEELAAKLTGVQIKSVGRRAKYLLLNNTRGTALVHLGMTGSLRWLKEYTEPTSHDHVELELASGWLRYTDIRRFGAWLWTDNLKQHPRIRELGVEPLGDELTGAYLQARLINRTQAIKLMLLKQSLIVGLGNIYASEALFRAGIHPESPSGDLSRRMCDKLVVAIKTVLTEAIAQGGTTIKNFSSGQGEIGHFQVNLQVYGREKQPCYVCNTPIEHIKQGQRSTFFCPNCQPSDLI